MKRGKKENLAEEEEENEEDELIIWIWCSPNGEGGKGKKSDLGWVYGMKITKNWISNFWFIYTETNKH